MRRSKSFKIGDSVEVLDDENEIITPGKIVAIERSEETASIEIPSHFPPQQFIVDDVPLAALKNLTS
jgi:hypothetical protein